MLIENLFIGYDKPILEELNLTLKNSSLTFLLGPNGVGKTTFLKTLGKILLPLKGNIQNNNSISYLSQITQVQKEITTIEYVLLVCQYKNLFPSLVQEKEAVNLLNTMNLDPRKKLRHLSGGQMQKLQIAQAIFHESKILLLDEPFSNLDFKNQMEIICLLKKLCIEGRSLLVAVHDLNLAIRYGDEMWIIHNKTIVSLNPYETDKIQSILGMPLYSYYSLENSQYAWLNY